MNMYPTSEEIAAGSYFLKELNNAHCILAIRIGLVAAAVIFAAMYIHVIRRNRQEKGNKK